MAGKLLMSSSLSPDTLHSFRQLTFRFWTAIGIDHRHLLSPLLISVVIWMMQAPVFAATNRYQIVGPVIVAEAVNMMAVLVRPEQSFELLFKHQPMLSDVTVSRVRMVRFVDVNVAVIDSRLPAPSFLRFRRFSWHNDQVFRAGVHLVAVESLYSFVSRDWTSEHLFCNKAVFRDVAVGIGAGMVWLKDHHVSIRSNESFLLREMAPPSATIVPMHIQSWKSSIAVRTWNISIRQRRSHAAPAQAKPMHGVISRRLDWKAWHQFLPSSPKGAK